MPHRQCTVSFVERGIRYEAKVDAASIYEAAVLALKQWDAKRYMKGPHRETMLEIDVVAPKKFKVRTADIFAWLYSKPGKTPAERDLKQRLQFLLSEGR